MFETILYSVEKRPHDNLFLNRPEDSMVLNIPGVRKFQLPWKMQKKMEEVKSIILSAEGKANLFQLVEI